jgi:hypothetical protein
MVLPRSALLVVPDYPQFNITFACPHSTDQLFSIKMPFIPAHAQSITSIDPAAIPIASRQELLALKAASCGYRGVRALNRKDAEDFWILSQGFLGTQYLPLLTPEQRLLIGRKACGKLRRALRKPTWDGKLPY